MTEWIAVVVIITTAVYAITIYNYLVRDRQRTRAGWSDIEVQLKRRHDLIPKLIDAVKQYAAYEQATLDQVTMLRNKAGNPRGVEQQGELENNITRSLVSASTTLMSVCNCRKLWFALSSG